VASTALLLLRLLPPPPSPPPFPYTTLFRSPSESGQDLSVEIVAVVEPMQFLTGATLDTEDFTTAFPEIVEDDHLFVRAAQDADPAEVRDAVHAAVDDHPTMQVSSVAEVKNQFTEIMDIAFYTIAAMLGLAIIIAVFGI